MIEEDLKRHRQILFPHRPDHWTPSDDLLILASLMEEKLKELESRRNHQLYVKSDRFRG